VIKDVMRKFLYLLVLFPSIVWASSPLPVVELTPDNVTDFGFRVAFEVTSFGTTINLYAPESIEKCSYTGSSVEIKNATGEVVAVTYNRVSVHGSDPSIVGHIADKSLNMSVAVTYICPPDLRKRSKIYAVNSVSDYLVKTQSK
jgi:hypothetical protein